MSLHMEETKNFKYWSCFTIFGWMTNKLGLTGLEREVYAIIYQFSQDGNSRFTLGMSYLKSATGCESADIEKCLTALCDARLVYHETDYTGKHEYYVNTDILDFI